MQSIMFKAAGLLNIGQAYYCMGNEIKGKECFEEVKRIAPPPP